MRAAANGADLPLWGHSRVVLCTVLGHTIRWCRGPLGSLSAPRHLPGTEAQWLSGKEERNQQRQGLAQSCSKPPFDTR